MLAYIDSFAGLIPCRVESIYSHCGPSGMTGNKTPRNMYFVVTVTATRGAYKRGDKVNESARWIVPRSAIYRRGYHYKIAAYDWACEASKHWQ